MQINFTASDSQKGVTVSCEEATCRFGIRAIPLPEKNRRQRLQKASAELASAELGATVVQRIWTQSLYSNPRNFVTRVSRQKFAKFQASTHTHNTHIYIYIYIAHKHTRARPLDEYTASLFVLIVFLCLVQSLDHGDFWQFDFSDLVFLVDQLNKDTHTCTHTHTHTHTHTLSLISHHAIAASDMAYLLVAIKGSALLENATAASFSSFFEKNSSHGKQRYKWGNAAKNVAVWKNQLADFEVVKLSASLI